MKDVNEFLEKTMSFGLGLAAYSREKIESLVEEMVQKGEVAQKDARQLAADMVKKGEAQRDDMKKMIRDEIGSVLNEFDLVRKSDIREAVAAALADAGLEPKAKPKTTKTEK